MPRGIPGSSSFGQSGNRVGIHGGVPNILAGGVSPRGLEPQTSGCPRSDHPSCSFVEEVNQAKKLIK